MNDPEASLLIVEDDASLRISLSQIVAGFGYIVRSASDGFSALLEIRQMVPDLILSDLYMPGMSGFEFLSVVRRRFPAIKLIAMSGAFSSAGVPPGLAADAFYEKGTSLGTLLHIAEDLARMKKLPEATAKLLIVDDEVLTRTVLFEILIEHGYRVRSAGDAFSALHEIRREMPEWQRKVGTLYNKHGYACSEHGQGGDRYYRPSKSRTWLTSHQLLVRSDNKD